MDLLLFGRSALVSGSSRGIGRAIAELLHREGCSVCISGRSNEDVCKLVDKLGVRATGYAGDLQHEIECERVVQHTVSKFGKLDILICCVGSGRSVPPGEETREEWQRIMSLNFYATTSLVTAARPHLSHGHGVVTCISSICGLQPLGAPVTYSAAKAALNAFVKNMASPLGKEGIRINALAPGNILFDGSVWQEKLLENREGVTKMLKEQVPLNRLGAPEDVAAMAAFISSPRAAFVTGTVIVVDGGQLRA